eukprot:2644944-Rhodomonas_salina.1
MPVTVPGNHRDWSELPASARSTTMMTRSSDDSARAGSSEACRGSGLPRPVPCLLYTSPSPRDRG